MDHEQMNQDSTSPNERAAGTATSEPVRSRWTPKPEQIQILESIFNSGTVNPAKDETIKIRKILEQYGSVGDANVFYWFQNRRSRSRRRQRQLQAAAAAAGHHGGISGSSAAVPYELPTSSSSSSNSNTSGSGFLSYCCPSSSVTSSSSSSSPGFVGDDGYADDLFSISRQLGYNFHENGQNPYMYSNSDASQLQYQSGTITVFINGIPSEVPRGTFDMRAMFGQDVVLVHSSGALLPINEYGHLLQSLQMGESYFLVLHFDAKFKVSRPT